MKVPLRAGIKVVYISGTSRCGSTLLGRVLGQADGVQATGELNLIWRRGVLDNELCSCGAPFRDCAFWHDLFQHAYGGFDRVDAQGMVDFLARTASPRRLPRLVVASRTSGIAPDPHLDVLGRLYQAIGDLTGRRVLVDTSKHPGYALLVQSLPGIDLRLVHLVRDSRAVTFSWQRLKVRFETAERSVLMGRRSPGQAALVWSRANLVCELLRFGSRHYSRLRYEDFARSPRQVVADLARRTGEDLTALPWVGEQAVELHDSHLPSGNTMRFQQGRVDIRVDDEWRRKLAPEARRLVTAFTWPLLVHYGYVGRARGTRTRADVGVAPAAERVLTRGGPGAS